MYIITDFTEKLGVVPLYYVYISQISNFKLSDLPMHAYIYNNYNRSP